MPLACLGCDPPFPVAHLAAGCRATCYHTGGQARSETPGLAAPWSRLVLCLAEFLPSNGLFYFFIFFSPHSFITLTLVVFPRGLDLITNMSQQFHFCVCLLFYLAWLSHCSKPNFFSKATYLS